MRGNIHGVVVLRSGPVAVNCALKALTEAWGWSLQLLDAQVPRVVRHVYSIRIIQYMYMCVMYVYIFTDTCLRTYIAYTWIMDIRTCIAYT